MKKIGIAAAVGLIIALPAQAQVSPNTRLLQRPERDGAIFTGPWGRAELRYQNWVWNNTFLFGPTFAAPLLEDHLEIGARGYFIYFNPDYIADRGHISDIDIWGKYLVLDDPFLLSVGGLVALPTGSDKIGPPWASGETNLESFAALRHYVNRDFALTGHAGLRYNSNIGKGWAKTEGKISLSFGGGAIFQVTPELNILSELNVETERYEWANNTVALTGGFEYLLGKGLNLLGGLSIGLDDVSPDFELSAGLNYLF